MVSVTRFRFHYIEKTEAQQKAAIMARTRLPIGPHANPHKVERHAC